MSYSTIARSAVDPTLADRIIASTVSEAWNNPAHGTTEFGANVQASPENGRRMVYPVCIASDVEAAYSVRARRGDPESRRRRDRRHGRDDPRERSSEVARGPDVTDVDSVFGDDEPEDAWHPDDPVEELVANLDRRLVLLGVRIRERRGTISERLDEIVDRVDRVRRRPILTDRERERIRQIDEDVAFLRERIR